MPNQPSFSHSTPEKQGISSTAILAFLEAVEQNNLELHSFLLVRHGYKVGQGWWSPYSATRPHMLLSLSKIFTSTAVGLAVNEGRLTVDDPVLAFFPNEAPANPCPHLAAMRVRDLLTMTSGHAIDTLERLYTSEDGNWVKAFLALPVEHEPGATFVYNSGATYMLSAIVQKVTDTTLLNYLQPRLFTPLGIKKFSWESCPRGINTGGWGLFLKTEDIARFGQLYLQKGLWHGQRLIPEAWIETATAYQVASSNQDIDRRQGYGYQFWRCRHNAYYGYGAYGQFCIIMPDQNAVLVITGGVYNSQTVLDLVWAYLLPAMQNAPLVANRSLSKQLRQSLARLSLAPVQGKFESSTAVRVSNKIYYFAPYEQHPAHSGEAKVEAVALNFCADTCTFTLWDTNGKHQVLCGNGFWQKGKMTALGPSQAQPVVASGSWVADNIFEMRLCFYITPFCATITCRFIEDRLYYDMQINVSSSPTERLQLVGIMASLPEA